MITDITAHMIVKNEDQYVWYAIQSVLPYVKKIIIYDTGSLDNTVEIIKTIKNPKIQFEQKGNVNPQQLVSFRQEQIDKTTSNWCWIVDGDEVYPRKVCEKITEEVKDNTIAGLIVHRYDLLGDVYHRQDDRVGAYNQFGIKGHYVLRLINKKILPGLKVEGEYPNEYFTYNQGKNIKKLGKEKFKFIEERLFHAMYLRRSSLGAVLNDTLHRNKWKVELGLDIPLDEIPEVFAKQHPEIVPETNKKRSFVYIISAMILTPLKKIKRLFIP